MNLGRKDLPPISENQSESKEKAPTNHVIGVIMSGGLGKRIKEVTPPGLSKPLIQLSDSILLVDVPISLMKDAGVEEIILLTSPEVDEKIKQKTSRRGVDYYVGERSTTTGPFERLARFLEVTQISLPIILAHSDEVFTNLDLKAMYEEHREKKHGITILVSDVETMPRNPQTEYFDFDDTGRVLSMEKISKNGIRLDVRNRYYPTGIKIIEPEFFPDIINAKNWYTVMSNAFLAGKLYAYPTSSFINVNTPEALAAARKMMESSTKTRRG